MAMVLPSQAVGPNTLVQPRRHNKCCQVAINITILSGAGVKKAGARSHEYDADAFLPIHGQDVTNLHVAKPAGAAMRTARDDKTRRAALQCPPHVNHKGYNKDCGGDERPLVQGQSALPAS